MSKKHTYSSIGLLVFHAIGMYLFISDPSNSQLSYLNMILCALVLFAMEKGSSLIPLIVISLGGYTVELIGIQTGYLFGDYSYQSALGTKLLDVPIVIGLNWYCVVVASSALIKTLKWNLYLSALISALLCTGLDFLIEPVAIKYDFWSWSGGEIPVYNYISWFVFSFLFALLYLKKTRSINSTAISLFFIWIAFFTVLNFIP